MDIHDSDSRETIGQAAAEGVRQLRRQRRRKPTAKTNERRDVIIGNMDITIYLVVLILILVGIVMVFSASYLTTANSPLFGHDPYFFLIPTIRFAILGFIVMNVVSRVSYEIIRPFSSVIYLVTIGLLIAVIIIGVATRGQTRWLELPFIGQFQPSEVAKLSIIFWLAFLVEKYPKALSTWFGLAVYAGFTVLLSALVFYGGMSAAIVVGAIGIGMVFIASPKFWVFILSGAGVSAAVALFLWWDMTFTGGFRGTRVLAWQNPWADPLHSGYQIVQTLFALGSGGWFGLGIGQSRQAFFIPEAYNDMIFAIIVEELGLIGAGMILILFGIFIWRGVVIALKAPCVYSFMVASGIVFAIGFQTVMHLAVVTNTIPNTGVNLPFISYGGTSLLVSMAMVGVLLNISRYSKVRQE